MTVDRGNERVPATGNGSLIELAQAAKTYGSGELAVHALRPTSLSIGAGQMIVMLGPSGSGKTTFLNLVGGIERLSAGELRVDGRDLSALSLNELQSFSPLIEADVYDVLTLEGSVAARRSHGGTAPEQVRAAIGRARRDQQHS